MTASLHPCPPCIDCGMELDWDTLDLRCGLCERELREHGRPAPPPPTLIDRDPLAYLPAGDHVNLMLGVQCVPFAFEMPDPAGTEGARLYVAGSVDYAGRLLNAVAYDLSDGVTGMRPVADWWADR